VSGQPQLGEESRVIEAPSGHPEEHANTLGYPTLMVGCCEARSQHELADGLRRGDVVAPKPEIIDGSRDATISIEPRPDLDRL